MKSWSNLDLEYDDFNVKNSKYLVDRTSSTMNTENFTGTGRILINRHELRELFLTKQRFSTEPFGLTIGVKTQARKTDGKTKIGWSFRDRSEGKTTETTGSYVKYKKVSSPRNRVAVEQTKNEDRWREFKCKKTEIKLAPCVKARVALKF